jgi:peptidoglycan/LPS O-acetylase OafA/YrhL
MNREVVKLTLLLIAIEGCALLVAALVLPASDRPSFAYSVIVVILASAGLLLAARKIYTFPIELIAKKIRNFVRGEG